MTVQDRHGKSNGQGQGSHWIRPEKRLAIYLRDGMACCYCGAAVEDGAQLTLDHLTPHSQGGSNSQENIVTACLKCNSSRGARDWQEFAHAVADYLNHGIRGEDIIEHILDTTQRLPKMTDAKALIARRGGYTAALHGTK